MVDSTHPPQPNELPDPETAYGGADAVEKTTYVVGRGTTPEARERPDTPPPVGKPGPGIVVWIALAIAILVAIGLLGGVFR